MAKRKIVNNADTTEKEPPVTTPGAAKARRRGSYHKPIVPEYTPNDSRVCLLTGASGLLGTEFIKCYSLDYKIIGIHNDHEIAPPQELVDPLFASVPIKNPPITAIRVDLSDPNEIDALCKHMIKTYGKVDLLINAACHRYWGPMTDSRVLDSMEIGFNINVLAPVRLAIGLAREFWFQQSWEENDGANRNVINISSTAGSYVYEDSGQSLYSATKAALNYYSHHMASEFWDSGVRVNTIAPNTFPGIISTSLVLETIIGCDTGRQTGEHIILDD